MNDFPSSGNSTRMMLCRGWLVLVWATVGAACGEHDQGDDHGFDLREPDYGFELGDANGPAFANFRRTGRLSGEERPSATIQITLSDADLCDHESATAGTPYLLLEVGLPDVRDVPAGTYAVGPRQPARITRLTTTRGGCRADEGLGTITGTLVISAVGETFVSGAFEAQGEDATMDWRGRFDASPCADATAVCQY